MKWKPSSDMYMLVHVFYIITTAEANPTCVVVVEVVNILRKIYIYLPDILVLKSRFDQIPGLNALYV